MSFCVPELLWICKYRTFTTTNHSFRYGHPGFVGCSSWTAVLWPLRRQGGARMKVTRMAQNDCHAKLCLAVERSYCVKVTRNENQLDVSRISGCHDMLWHDLWQSWKLVQQLAVRHNLRYWNWLCHCHRLISCQPCDLGHVLPWCLHILRKPCCFPGDGKFLADLLYGASAWQESECINCFATLSWHAGSSLPIY